MAPLLKWMPAAAFGGLFKRPAPVFVTIHCTESDNTPAIAESLAGPNWFGGPAAGTSTHKIVDVDSICEGVHRDCVAYHAGPGGNTWGVAYEFCGRASWSAAKWREPAQLQMLRNAAPHIADDLRAMGAPARWLSIAQVAAKAGGMCTHNDVRLAFPGTTTHSDPGPNFPYAELLGYVLAELSGGFPIIGAIRQRYDTVVLAPATWGYFLGQPQGPEVPTFDGVGRWQEFANGVIYWTPDTGAHVVWGDILKRWRAVGSEIATGFPITDERATPDTVGRYNHFAGGWSIYWTPQTGAWDVHGWFREAWAASGWELGPWGYPVSSEYPAMDGVLAQNFQKGRVVLRDGAVAWEPSA